MDLGEGPRGSRPPFFLVFSMRGGGEGWGVRMTISNK